MRKQNVGVFMAFGTQGDVLPVAVVAAALAKAASSYTITFITHASHQSLRALLADSGVIFSDVASPAVLPPTAGHASCDRLEIEMNHRKECLQAVEKAFGCAYGLSNFIAVNFFALEGWHIAEVYNAQCMVVAPYVVPYSAPASFERMFKEAHPLLYQRLQWSSLEELGWNDILHWMWPLFMDRWTSWRRELQLSAVPLTDPVTELPLHAWPRASPVLYGVSKEIVECPGYWPPSVRTCGFWFAPEHWEHAGFPSNLRSFISRSCAVKPVFFGLSSAGSMGFLHNPEGMLHVLRHVFLTLDRRCILFTAGYPPLEAAILKFAESESSTSEGLTLFDDRVFCYSGFIPYSKLFGECSLVIHHGGSGTTAACLRTGIAQVICPFIHDQFYWAERMAWLGVAPQPLESKFLVPRADRELLDCVSAVVAQVKLSSSDEMQRRAMHLAQKLSLEDGCRDAVDVFIGRVCA